MSKLCTNCGRTLEKDAKFCVDCGKPVTPETREEKRTKYALTKSQRYDFLRKILPTILAGSIIWLISELIFSMIFIEIEFNQIFLVFYISTIIIEAILFVSLYFVSKNNKLNTALFIFFIFSFIAGILSLPLIMITEFLPQVHMFVSLSIGALLITSFIGIILRDNYFAKGYIWAHLLLFLIGTVLVEVVFIIIFDIHNFLLTIPVSLAYIMIVSLTTMFYGSKVVQKNEEKPWILNFYKIEGLLLVSLIIAIVVVVVVLILVWIGIAAGGSDFSFSGIGGGSNKSRKKRKTK
ncbi:MAG: zinc-ribbon domain-containing protein [Candidatus Thorarchaeota archaeon]